MSSSSSTSFWSKFSSPVSVSSVIQTTSMHDDLHQFLNDCHQNDLFAKEFEGLSIDKFAAYEYPFASTESGLKLVPDFLHYGEMLDHAQYVPPLLEVVANNKNTHKIGKGKYGNVFVLRDKQTGVDKTKYCFKVQYLQDESDVLHGQLTAMSNFAVFEGLHPERSRKGTAPVSAGCRAHPFVLETLGLYTIQRLIPNQTVTPKLYGTFFVLWKDPKTGSVRIGMVTVMEYLQDFETLTSCLERIMQQQQQQPNALSSIQRILKNVMKTLDMLESHPKFLLHNYDCHSDNIMVRKSNPLDFRCLDFGMSSFLFPLEFFCTFADSLLFKSEFDMVCLNDAIPMVFLPGDEQGGAADHYRVYGSDRLWFSCMQYVMTQQGFDMQSPMLENFRAFVKFVQPFVEQIEHPDGHHEQIYSLPPDVLCKTCSEDVRRKVFDDTMGNCSHDEIQQLASALFVDNNQQLMNEIGWFERFKTLLTSMMPPTARRDTYEELVHYVYGEYSIFFHNDKFSQEFLGPLTKLLRCLGGTTLVSFVLRNFHLIQRYLQSNARKQSVDQQLMQAMETHPFDTLLQHVQQQQNKNAQQQALLDLVRFLYQNPDPHMMTSLWMALLLLRFVPAEDWTTAASAKSQNVSNVQQQLQHYLKRLDHELQTKLKEVVSMLDVVDAYMDGLYQQASDLYVRRDPMPEETSLDLRSRHDRRLLGKDWEE